MEKRQLDLNKPLLSVRRIPKLGYRSAMSGEIVQRPHAERRVGLVPPPSHFSVSNNMEQVTKPAAVPFVWEHIPGRSKSKSGPLYFARDEQQQLHSISPRFPPGRVREKALLQGHVKDFDEMYVQKPQTRDSSPIVRTAFEISDVSVSDKETRTYLDADGNDEFADALDTLLPEETFSMNCSVSGLSGDEGLNATSSRNYSTDTKTQDFLMSRFLPAAKAMTLESPQYAIKKQLVAVEEPKLVKRLSNAERRPQPLAKHYKSSNVLEVDQDLVGPESESDNESCDTSNHVSVRACGFLPRFCLKNSLAIITQITDVKGRSQSPRVTRIESQKVAKSPSTRPATPTRVPDKHAWEASHKRILERKAEHLKLAEANIDKQIEEYLKSNAMPEANRVSPHRNSARRSISPYRNQRPPSPFREGVGFLGIPKEAEKSKAKDSSYNNGAGSDHDALPPVEKTLYIDYVNSVKKSDYNLDQVVKREADPFHLTEKKTIGPESIPYVMRRLRELRFSKREATDSFIATRPSLSGVRRARDPKLVESGLNSKPSSFVKVSSENDLKNAAKDQYSKDDAAKTLALVASPPPPPLPKLPSESWLWRTLPSMPSKNPFSGLKRSLSRPSSPLAKWETIVKSSKLQNDHKRYSAELSTDVLKQYRK